MTTGALGVRVVRVLGTFAPFLAFAWLSPKLYEARLLLKVDGAAPVVVRHADEDVDRAVAGCRAVAARMAATRPVAPATPRDAALARVVDFLVAHPELPASAAPATPSGLRRPDTARLRLQQERDRLQSEIQRGPRRVASSGDSDNPFADGPAAPPPVPSDAQLKRRLAEIDAILAAAPAPSPDQSPTTVLPAELDALALAVPAPAAFAPPRRPPEVLEAGLTTRVVAPESRWLFAVGFVVALAAALLPVAGARRSSRRMVPRLDPVPEFPNQRGDSERPAPTPAPVSNPPARQIATSAAATMQSAPPPRAPAPVVRAEPPPPVVRADPPPDESPVMAYPVPWSLSAVPDRARYSSLRDEVKGHSRSDCFVVAVTAADAAPDGKPALAAGLAASFAEDVASRVLLVEADLRHPAVAGALGVAMVPATDLVAQLEARIAGLADRHWYVLKCSQALHVLPARADAPDLLLSTHFEACLAELRPFYDVIIVHSPALDDAVACRAVSDVVDGAIIGRRSGEVETVETATFSSKRLVLDFPIGTA